MNKTKKIYKIKKCADFGQAGKISVQLGDEYHENVKNVKIWKFQL